MAIPQSPRDLAHLSSGLVGEEFAELKVLGINNLKSIAAPPADLVGRRITAATAAEPSIAVDAGTSERSSTCSGRATA